MDEIARLQAEVDAAVLELKLAQDREFCKPDIIRTVLMDIARANGGIPGAESMTLQDLAAKIIVEVGRTHHAYTSSLWDTGRDKGC